MRKRTRQWLARSFWTACAALTFVIAFGLSSACADGNASTQGGGKAEMATPQEGDPEAMLVLLGMAEFLARTPSFGVTIRSGYDAIQADGQRIEFGEKRRITLRRPDRVRVDVERSDGDRGLLLYDGMTLTAFKPSDNIFAQVDKNGTVDDVLVYMVKDLGLTLPLARMFHSGFRQSLEKMTTSASFVEENFLFDVPTDHLTARSQNVDLQIWIAQGEQPLPRRAVITYKSEPGQPQFWAELSDWDFSTGSAGESFAFTPPAGAEKVPLLAPGRRAGSLPEQKGGAQ